MKKITISPKNSGQRIDKFLTQEFFCNEKSRGEIIRLIKEGKVIVGRKKIKPSYVLKEGDEVEVKETKKNSKIKPNEKIFFEVIFKNDDFIIIDKPAGLAVHPVDFESEDTLVNGLVAKFPEIENVGDDPLRPGIVHRLDRETSGVMIVARNQESFELLKKSFKNREVQKKYLALVWGNLEKKKDTIKKPIARSSDYKKQVIAGKKTKTKVREAVTEYEVKNRFPNFDLVEARPKTGRMHQIRVHFFSIGHPVVGDKKYKLKKISDSSSPKRQLLHAKEIRFFLRGKEYSFQSELPSDFEKYL